MILSASHAQLYHVGLQRARNRKQPCRLVSRLENLFDATGLAAPMMDVRPARLDCERNAERFGDTASRPGHRDRKIRRRSGRSLSRHGVFSPAAGPLLAIIAGFIRPPIFGIAVKRGR